MALPTNNSASILSAIPSLVQLFVGSGKQTGTKTTTSSKTANSSSINALSSILGQAAPSTDAAVKNAIDLMFRQGMPSIGSVERNMGIYNSSNTREAVNQLGATAAAKAAELDLNQQNKATDQKITAAGTLGQLTASDTTTTSDTEQTGAAVDPLMAALGLGGAMGLNYFLGNGSSKKQPGSDSTSAPAASNVDITPTINKQGPIDFLSSISLDSFASDIAGGLKSSTFDPVSGQQVTGGSNELLGVLQDVASNSLITGIGNFFGGLFGGGSSGGSSEGSSMGTVICTRMHELGYLDDDTYSADKIYGLAISIFNPNLYSWYHSWAIPFVANWLHGRTLGSKLVIQAMRPVVLVWSAWMKHEVRKAGIQWQV